MYARAAVCLVVGPLCPHPHPCARTLPSLKYEPGEWELRWPSPRFGGRRGGGGVGGWGGGGGGGLCPQPHQQQPAVPEAAPGTEAAELE